ncbi:MAG: hypothetical protein R3B99_03535 [Polyangiales bacterium]
MRRKLERLVTSANRRRPREPTEADGEEAEKLAGRRRKPGARAGAGVLRGEGLAAGGGVRGGGESNHLHLVLRAPGKNLAAFMGYFLAPRVAQTLNLLLGRVGPVFPRRYDAQPILDEECAVAGREVRAREPEEAGRFTEWPELVAVAVCNTRTTCSRRSTRPLGMAASRSDLAIARFWKKGRLLKLSRLPGMESLARRAYLATVKSWCDSPPPDRCLGVEGVLDADVHQRDRRSPSAHDDRTRLEALSRSTPTAWRVGSATPRTTSPRALAKLGDRVEWPECMYAPGGAVAA